MRSALAGEENAGLLSITAISDGVSHAMMSLPLSPSINDQVNDAANRDDRPGHNGEEPCLAAPHFAFPWVAASTLARVRLRFVMLCGATACERIRSDFMVTPHNMTNLLQHHTRNVKQLRGKQGIHRRVDAKFEDEISRAGRRESTPRQRCLPLFAIIFDYYLLRREGESFGDPLGKVTTRRVGK